MADADQDALVAEMVSEISAAVSQAGQLEAWIAKRLDGTHDEAAVVKAVNDVAGELLTSDSPQTGTWEHLLVTLTFLAGREHQKSRLTVCRSVLDLLRQLMAEDRMGKLEESKLVTIACGMTVALAIEDKLRQEIEATMLTLCDHFPEALPRIAADCQEIWKRRGQMSGRPGLFLWDQRREEWRLAQEFKPYRSEDNASA